MIDIMLGGFITILCIIFFIKDSIKYYNRRQVVPENDNITFSIVSDISINIE